MFHPNLDKDKWVKMSIVEQFANIGSELERAMSWINKGNKEYADLANYRALELFDLTISSHKDGGSLRELCRARELWLDFFIGDNVYQQTEAQWHKYIHYFTYASRNPTRYLANNHPTLAINTK